MKRFVIAALFAFASIVGFAQNKNKERVTLLVAFEAKADQREAFKNALIADRKGAEKEKGNISIELYEHKDKPNVFYLFERWVNQKALDKHLAKKYVKAASTLGETALVKPKEVFHLTDISPLPKSELKTPLANDTPLDLVVIFDVKEGTRDAVIKQFQKSIENTRPEPGNIGFFFHTLPGDSTKFVLYERWRSQAALDSHFSQPYSQELFALLKSTLKKPVEAYLNFITEIGKQ